MNMFMAALIFVMSMAVVIQFSVLSWRAALIRAAAEALPFERERAAGSALNSLFSQGFASISAYSRLSPDFADGSYLKLRSVSMYYRGLEFLKNLGQSAWAADEMKLCTRYAAVMLSQHLERNQATLASLQSF
jgi:hypothetical protein